MREFTVGEFVMLGAEVVDVRDGYLEVKLFDYEKADFEPWTVEARFCYPFSEWLRSREDKQLMELTEWLKAER